MSKWREGYKVLKASNRSSIMSRKKVKYLKNRTAKRPKKCGPLTLFSSREDAEYVFGFLLNDNIALLVKCEYLPSKCKTIWVEKHKKAFRWALDELPLGTVLAEQIRCLE